MSDAIDEAVILICNALKRTKETIVMAGIVRYYAATHPEEFKEVKRKVEEKLESQENKNSVFLLARMTSAEIIESLAMAKAPLLEPEQLYEMLKNNPKFKGLSDNDLRSIADQEFKRRK